MARNVKKTIKTARDAVHETIHRGNAAAEREVRTDIGPTMTPGQKAKSMVREASEKTKAEIDRTKRKVRKHT